MRFFEFEAREVVKRAGIPVTDYGFTTDAAEAREIAQRIGGPTVIKSQVLTGGRMKAGGVKFADTPEEAESHARDILQLEINGHAPRGVLVDPKAEVAQEYYAGVVWDGIKKQPVMIFSPDPDEVAFAKKVIEAIPDGRGVHMIDGKMQDDATWKQAKVLIDLAKLVAAKDPEMGVRYGL